MCRGWVRREGSHTQLSSADVKQRAKTPGVFSRYINDKGEEETDNRDDVRSPRHVHPPSLLWPHLMTHTKGVLQLLVTMSRAFP